ncbi:MAG: glycosyltransferase, partial [Lentisphaeria bacterium]|nr:glycosyltransferase [Lentisphaeria bacterium]
CEYLKRCHVGIMPLTDDEFSRGKSAYKLLQCQAAGLPLAASPVGENKIVVIPGKNGFLPESTEEWLQAFNLLQHDKLLYKSYSEESAAMAYEYSLQKYFPIYINFINKVFF